MKTYDARIIQAKQDLEKIMSEHGINVLLDALTSIADEMETHFVGDDHVRDDDGAIWGDVVSVLRVLRNMTKKLVGIELPTE